MELGYFTTPLHPPGSDQTETLQKDLEQMVILDELGFSEAWIGEHLTAAWENIPIPDMFIAYALPLTKKIKLGTGVTCLPNHHPFTIAQRISLLDHLARGRFQWGVGSGGFPGDFEVFGFDPTTGDHRKMTQESLELIVKLWNDPKPGVYESKYWKFTVPEPVDEIALRFHLKPYQKPHPPIFLAGGLSGKSGTLVMAGQLGYSPMSTSVVLWPNLRSHWECVEQGASISGKTPDRSTWRIAREVYVADSTEEARREARRGTMRRDFDYWQKLMAYGKVLGDLKTDPEMPDSDVTADYLMETFAIVGSPDDVADEIRRMYEYVGGFGALLVMGHEWHHPEDRWEHSMELLAKEVMPKLADLG